MCLSYNLTKWKIKLSSKTQGGGFVSPRSDNQLSDLGSQIIYSFFQICFQKVEKLKFLAH